MRMCFLSLRLVVACVCVCVFVCLGLHVCVYVCVCVIVYTDHAKVFYQAGGTGGPAVTMSVQSVISTGGLHP